MYSEGIPTGRGYVPQYQLPFVKETVNNEHYRRIYSKERLSKYFSELKCPDTENIVVPESLWFGQSMLRGTKTDMEMVAEAIKKIQANASQLAKA